MWACPFSAGGSGDPSPSTRSAVSKASRRRCGINVGSSRLQGCASRSRDLGMSGTIWRGALGSGRGADGFRNVIKRASVEEAVAAFGAEAVASRRRIRCRHGCLAPCALAPSSMMRRCARLKAGIIAGAANNQLAIPAHGRALSSAESSMRRLCHQRRRTPSVGAEITKDTEEAGERRVRASATPLLPFSGGGRDGFLQRGSRPDRNQPDCCPARASAA